MPFAFNVTILRGYKIYRPLFFMSFNTIFVMTIILSSSDSAPPSCVAICWNTVTTNLKVAFRDELLTWGAWTNLVLVVGCASREAGQAYVRADESAAVQVKVTLRSMVSQSLSQSVSQSVSRSVCLGVKPHLGSNTRFLLLPDSFMFADVGSPLWQEDESVVYNFCWP
jgi:hypothetical protein